jgi:rhodanese-related sulfurtransferase
MLPIPFPLLSTDRKVYVVRAHRMRSQAVATFVRDIVRVVTGAAR